MNNIGGCMPRVNDTYIDWIEVQSKDVQGWHYYTTFSYIMSKRLMMNTEAYSKSSLENVYFLYFYSNHRSLEFMHEKEEKKRLEQRIAMLMYVSV